MAGIKKGETILEPSAGKGAIARYIMDCDCVESNEENRKYLSKHGYNLVGNDFLTFNQEYDVIIANPPFSKQQALKSECNSRRLALIGRNDFLLIFLY